MSQKSTKLSMQSPDLTADHIEQIGSLFPQVIVEIPGEDGSIRRGIDFDLLRQELEGDVVEGREERYEFTWVGKRRSIVEANRPVHKTLRPCISESKDWEKTKNIFIEGDNLDALKLLQESYLNSVKMIYIDPPYNTGNDFIYNDTFVMDSDEYDEETGAIDEAGNRMFKNGKDRGRYHSDWCSMLYPRLKLAKNLLRDDGVIFVSIDDNEVHNLRKMMDEIFGDDNFVTTLHVEMSGTQGMKLKAAKMGNIVKNGEYILIYSKNGSKQIGISPLYDPTDYDTHYSLILKKSDNGGYNESRIVDDCVHYENIVLELEAIKLLDPKNKNKKLKNSDLPTAYNLSPSFREYIHKNQSIIVTDHNIDGLQVPNDILKKVDTEYIFEWTNEHGKKYYLIRNSQGNIRQRIPIKEKINLTHENKPQYRVSTIRGDWWSGFYLDMGNVNKEGNIGFNNGKKPMRLIKEIAQFVTNKEDVILDFFGGSATTAHAIMQLNYEDTGYRKFILIQLPEICSEDTENLTLKNIADIGKERIRQAGEQIKTQIEQENSQSTLTSSPKPIPDIGFRVFKVDDTNMKDVYYSATEYNQETIEGLIDNLKEDRTDLDLLYQVLLSWGLKLDLTHTTETIDNFTIHHIDPENNTLIACFDSNIPEEVMRKIAQMKPLRAVFRDGSFKDSPGKLNIDGIFKTLSPNTTVRVI